MPKAVIDPENPDILKLPRGYRWLGAKELTQKGDLFAQTPAPAWEKARDYIGYSTLGEHRWIRRVDVKSAPRPTLIRLSDLPKALGIKR